MSAQGQIRDTPVVAAVNPVRETIAGRARCGCCSHRGGNDQDAVREFLMNDGESGWSNG